MTAVRKVSTIYVLEGIEFIISTEFDEQYL